MTRVGRTARGRWRCPGRAGILALLAAAVTSALLLQPVSPTAATAAHQGGLAGACPDGVTPEDGFGDVPAASAHEPAVDCVVWWGLSTGAAWHTYGPDADVRRDEMASFVARLMEALGTELPADPPDAFDDDGASVHEHRIDQLAARGVVDGIGDRAYGPTRSLSRAQAASLLVRGYETATGRELPPGTDRFADDDGSAHEDAIDAAAEAGWARGVDADRYAPARALTRGEMASLLARVLDTGVEQGDAAPPEGWPTTDAPRLATELVTSAVDTPVFVTAPPGDDRLFVVERAGRVMLVDGGDVTTWLDIRDRVSLGSERGMFSIAFPPGWPEVGEVYVNYTGPSGDVRLARHPATPDAADPAGTVIETEPQPFGNHNGGQVAFGPDGNLWWSLGDGGGSGDPQGQGQDATTRKGAIARLDVRGGGGRLAGNVFAHADVWAIGLRNPWRLAFDEPTGAIVIADVGEASWEEVDVVPARSAGANFGWNVREGAHCFQASSCPTDGLIDPVYEYSHDDGCSITGGVVYRGSAIPELRGHYLLADLCSGFVRSLRLDADGVVGVVEHPAAAQDGSVFSFGEDDRGEVYLATSDGVFRLVAE